MIWYGMIWYQHEYVMSWPLDHIRYLIIISGTRIRITISIIRYMCLTHSLMRPLWSFLLGGVREARDGWREGGDSYWSSFSYSYSHHITWPPSISQHIIFIFIFIFHIRVHIQIQLHTHNHIIIQSSLNIFILVSYDTISQHIISNLFISIALRKITYHLMFTSYDITSNHAISYAYSFSFSYS